MAYYNKRVIKGEPESEELYLSIFEEVIGQKERESKDLDLKHDQLLEQELERQNPEKRAQWTKKENGTKKAKKGKKGKKTTSESESTSWRSPFPTPDDETALKEERKKIRPETSRSRGKSETDEKADRSLHDKDVEAGNGELLDDDFKDEFHDEKPGCFLDRLEMITLAAVCFFVLAVLVVVLLDPMERLRL